MTQQGTQGKDMSSGECRAVRGKKKGLQGLQAALVREIAFCVWLTKLLCLINRLCSEAVSGNRLRHGTGTFPGLLREHIHALEAFTWHSAAQCRGALSGFKRDSLDTECSLALVTHSSVWADLFSFLSEGDEIGEKHLGCIHQMQSGYELLIWK